MQSPTFESNEQPATRAPFPGPAHPAHRILLAEDDEDTRRMLATALRQDGYEVIEAKSGAELLDYVGSSVLFEDGLPPADIIISDIRMPGFTGTGILAGLRDVQCDTPFVIITAFGTEETREEARHMGADAVFHKPFDIDDFRTVVRNLLPRRTRPGNLVNKEVAVKDVESKTPEAAQRRRVLLAEDDVDTRMMLKQVLIFAGYDVVEVTDGMELMCFISSVTVGELEPPDLIVSDIRMPIFSGLDMLRSVQRCAIDAPVVLISAFCDESTRSLAEQFGAAALLRKPLSADELLTTLARLLPEPATGTAG